MTLFICKQLTRQEHETRESPNCSYFSSFDKKWIPAIAQFTKLNSKVPWIEPLLGENDTDKSDRKGSLRAGLRKLERPKQNPGALSVLESLTGQFSKTVEVSAGIASCMLETILNSYFTNHAFFSCRLILTS